MRKLLLVVPLLLAISADASVRTYPPGSAKRFIRTFPPSDQEQTAAGGGGPSDLLTDLQAYWHFEGVTNTPTGSPVTMGYDSILVHHLLNAGGLPSSIAAGKSGRAIQPDLSTGNGLSETSTSLRQPGDFTVSSWMKTTGIAQCASDGFLVDSDVWAMTAGAAPDYRVQTRGTGFGPPLMRFQIFDSGGTNSAVTVTVTATYKHYVVVYTASTKSFNLYTDNVLTATSAALATGLRQGGTTFSVVPPAFTQCQIDMDELGVWKRALSLADIACLFNSGPGFFHPFVGTCS